VAPNTAVVAPSTIKVTTMDGSEEFETNGTAAPHQAQAATVQNETNGTPRRKRTYRDLSEIFGYSPTTAWRDCNARRPAIRSWQFTLARSHRIQRQCAVCVASRVRGWSLRRIAAALKCGKSTIARDLRTVARWEQAHPDLVALATNVLAACVQSTEAGEDAAEQFAAGMMGWY
jgi:hypothetical protein